MRRCSPATSWHSSPSTADSLGPFAMYVAFPRADYYGPSAPSRGHQPTVGLPAAALAGRRGGRPRDGSHVHHAPVDRVGAQLCPCSLAPGTPQAFPGSLPAGINSRLWSRRPGPYRVARTAARPISTRFGAGSTLEGVQPLVHLRYAFRSRLPGPGRLAVPASSRRCQGCSRPPLHLQDQAALSFTGLLRQPGEAGLSPPSGHMAPRGAPAPRGVGPCSGWRWCTSPRRHRRSTPPRRPRPAGPSCSAPRPAHRNASSVLVSRPAFAQTRCPVSWSTMTTRYLWPFS